MNLRSLTLTLLLSLAPCACQPASDDDPDGSSAADSGSSSESDGSSGEAFDSSRWLGRYHAENPYLPFGERGDPRGTYVLFNFEVFPNGTATSLYDSCELERGIPTTYAWTAVSPDWLELRPGPGESSLRFFADTEIETLRVQLVEPCRALRFEVDGMPSTFFSFLPGESCWVDRCTTPGTMHVDYCAGEEPPACP